MSNSCGLRGPHTPVALNACATQGACGSRRRRAWAHATKRRPGGHEVGEKLRSRGALPCLVQVSRGREFIAGLGRKRGEIEQQPHAPSR